ncbi:hypothetical protein B9G69_014030 [Bdellovibrio sp. SKB1291214]|uniref:hypothetical protein n=1 Tax=Bdellovibrio sp. SKB1291214 TaxID=1732569 RepID=UPI000B51A5CD|nr:hypothetical protein [Bdellovibrio sp. SKB1291214]UYL08166.1 hypothetical protein B9G69_014030 [Bdellovibrio sp. SKB1291214]
MRKLVTAIIPVLILAACSHGDCRGEKKKNSQADGGAAVTSTTNTSDRVKVFKPDGSLQCGQGKRIPLPDMQKDLGSIQVFSSKNANDGMMRIQLCGSPTGNCNVYEIDRKDLAAAQKAGFKEWTAE